LVWAWLEVLAPELEPGRVLTAGLDWAEVYRLCTEELEPCLFFLAEGGAVELGPASSGLLEEGFLAFCFLLVFPENKNSSYYLNQYQTL